MADDDATFRPDASAGSQTRAGATAAAAPDGHLAPLAANSVLLMVVRRLRTPLLVIILSYAISVLGLTLIPGVEADGSPAPPLGFFHAFYFVSYTATTIGFGEVPKAFSDAQRMWAIVIVHLTVVRAGPTRCSMSCRCSRTRPSNERWARSGWRAGSAGSASPST
jgi:hypothetical protein